MTGYTIAQVGIDTPLRTLFDYRIPDTFQGLQTGARVVVPFGRREVTGLVMSLSRQSAVAQERLKDIQAVLDEAPLLDEASLALIEWAATYYQFPIGAALFSALPPLLRKPKPAKSGRTRYAEVFWQAIDRNHHNIQRAPKQAAILQWLHEQNRAVSADELNRQFPNSRPSVLALESHQLISRKTAPHASSITPTKIDLSNTTQLTGEQQRVSTRLCENLHEFGVHVIEGVTGSGKTEIYFKVIADILATQNGQVLLLVPEIGLAPQMQQRLQARFGPNIGVLHSGVSEAERKRTWLQVSAGKIKIILGTRLAVFTPLPELKLIIVDEEHDTSFKQHEGFLYHARDVAIYRAQTLNIPVILGSATPSFETLHNVAQQKYHHYVLAKRAQSTAMPSMHLVDMRKEHRNSMLSTALEQAMHRHLQHGQQVILFLNRRGYAPVLMCHDCGWVAQCQRCDANLTYHIDTGKLNCHHCESVAEKPPQCPQCGSENLILVGHGTQRVEEVLQQHYAAYSQVRLDRDITRRRGRLDKILAEIRDQKHQIIIGTQMLSKGHDFPNVSLVGVLDVDYGIFSADFRALERTAQLLIQVAGRSGRRSVQGEVIVQTHAPDHPLLNELLKSGYPDFAANALQLRAEWNLPPYTYQIALRANSQKTTNVDQFLQQAKQLAQQLLPAGIQIHGPISPNMEKKAGQFRAYLLITASRRNKFGRHLGPWLEKLSRLPVTPKVRWALDVDPIDNI